MSSKDDNLESLEQELKELKKKKLEKQIRNLEKDLNLDLEQSVTNKEVTHTPTIKVNTQPKSDRTLLVVFSVLFLAALAIFTINNGIVNLSQITEEVNFTQERVLDSKHMSNGSSEHTWGNRTGCIPTLYLDFSTHSDLAGLGIYTKVKIKDTDIEFNYELRGGKGHIALPTSSNFSSGDNLYNILNFAGQSNIVVEVSATNSKRIYYVQDLAVPQDIFALPARSLKTCDYRVNK